MALFFSSLQNRSWFFKKGPKELVVRFLDYIWGFNWLLSDNNKMKSVLYWCSWVKRVRLSKWILERPCSPESSDSNNEKRKDAWLKRGDYCYLSMIAWSTALTWALFFFQEVSWASSPESDLSNTRRHYLPPGLTWFQCKWIHICSLTSSFFALMQVLREL